MESNLREQPPFFTASEHVYMYSGTQYSKLEFISVWTLAVPRNSFLLNTVLYPHYLISILLLSRKGFLNKTYGDSLRSMHDMRELRVVRCEVSGTSGYNELQERTHGTYCFKPTSILGMLSPVLPLIRNNGLVINCQNEFSEPVRREELS